MVRVALPQHLRTLARLEGDAELEIAGPVTQKTVLDALEARYPVLRGTIRDHATRQRRPFLRFYVGEEDWSLAPPEAPLPESIAQGREPLFIIAAIAGG